MHFFLNWGKNSPDTEKNKTFFQAICAKGNRILIFPFSEGTEKDILFDQNAEHEFFEKWKNIIARYNLDKHLQFECSSRNISTLVEQIENSDILFFCWGKAHKHLEVTDRIPQLKKLLKDKVIAGGSAWATMRSKRYYRATTEEIKPGNGILPVKMMVHWWANRDSWLLDEEREKILEAYGEKLPMYKIPEQEYIEFDM
jgi:hypothetical protein